MSINAAPDTKGILSPPVLMIGSSLLFATMGMCAKLAATDYGAGEMVFYRGLVGALMIGLLVPARKRTLRTGLPAMHFWRCLTGVSSLGLWFYAIGELPLATAVTLNYMAPIWMALLLMGSATLLGGERVDGRLVCTAFVGFVGIICVLQPTIESGQLWPGLMGLLSGLLAGIAYIQVSSLGRAGEPEDRIVFYFSLGSIGAGALGTSIVDGWHALTLQGFGLLLAVGVLATLAQLLLTRAYRTGRMLVNASLQYLVIVWSYAYGVLLFDDPVTGLALLGMGLIAIAGIAATRQRQSHQSINRIDTSL